MRRRNHMPRTTYFWDEDNILAEYDDVRAE
jgi:hypothetical protein